MSARPQSYQNEPIPGPPTEIRSRWTDKTLYLLYICPYDELNLKPDPNPAVETPRLWNWDVAEAFIGTDFDHIARYKELQVSPQSEWVDLDINRDDTKAAGGMAWNSGYKVKGRIDRERHIWYGEMAIPMSAIGVTAAKAGTEMRVGLYRIAGTEYQQEKLCVAADRPNHLPRAAGVRPSETSGIATMLFT